MKSPCSVLTIIVTYNGMTWIERCIKSVLSSSVSADVLIVDNGSTDGTPEYIRRFFPKVELIQSPNNLGFGKANNIGLIRARDANYDYAYLLNQDAWILPDTLELLISANLHHPEYGILSPIQLYPDMNNVEWSFDVIAFKPNYSCLIQDQYFNRLQEVYPVDFVQAAHWLISKRCYQTVGGFSPAFPHYGEDNNYCERAIYHGFRIGIVPCAQAVHDNAAKPQPTRKQKQNKIYVVIVDRLSNINDQHTHSLRKLIFSILSWCKSERSLDPLVMLVRALSNHKLLEAYKKESLNVGAFMEPVDMTYKLPF